LKDINTNTSETSADLTVVSATLDDQLSELETANTNLTNLDTLAGLRNDALDEIESDCKTVAGYAASTDSSNAQIVTNTTLNSKTAALSWTNTVDSGYAGSADYTTTWAKAHWTNDTGASVKIKAVRLHVITDLDFSTFNYEGFFSGTTSNTNRLHIGVDSTANQSANSVETIYANLRANYMLQCFRKSSLGQANSVTCTQYEIGVKFDVANGDHVAIGFKENVSGDTEFKFFATLEYYRN
jgi:hypothetical protein